MYPPQYRDDQDSCDDYGASVCSEPSCAPSGASYDPCHSVSSSSAVDCSGTSSQQYCPPAQKYCPPAQKYCPPAQKYCPPQQKYCPPQKYWSKSPPTTFPKSTQLWDGGSRVPASCQRPATSFPEPNKLLPSLEREVQWSHI
uniref:Epidermal differentiation protein n=1 Tax=Podarcis muralis TaxID=64176 RepID=A0A670JSA9_PODMU